MKNTIRLLIALGFAAFAAAMNFLWIQQNRPEYGDYVAYAESMPLGTVIESDSQFTLVKLPVRSGFRNSSVYILWENRSDLLQYKTVRAIQKGELALQTDITAKVPSPEFSTLGPFRLLSVRDQFVNRSEEGNTNTSHASGGGVIGRIPVTLIIPKDIDSKTGLLKYEPKIKQLLHILDQDRSQGSSILAIVAMSGSSPASRGDQDQRLKDNEAAIVIDLPNIPVITDVLLNNPAPEIGFVVPLSLIPSTN